MVVQLQPITEHNVDAVFALKVAPGQESFVASNPRSLAQALAEYEVAWPRAIAVDERVVGFLMLEIDLDDDDGQFYWLWRLMIAEGGQGKGYGAAAVNLALDELRSRGAIEAFTSWMPGDGSPEGFYLKLGFKPTGEVDDDEIVARIDLST